MKLCYAYILLLPNNCRSSAWCSIRLSSFLVNSLISVQFLKTFYILLMDACCSCCFIIWLQPSDLRNSTFIPGSLNYKHSKQCLIFATPHRFIGTVRGTIWNCYCESLSPLAPLPFSPPYYLKVWSFSLWSVPLDKGKVIIFWGMRMMGQDSKNYCHKRGDNHNSLFRIYSA